MKLLKKRVSEGFDWSGSLPALQLEDVVVKYGSNYPSVLKKVSLTMEHKTFVSILGRSGVGKTTLLRTIAGFERVASGYVRVGGRLVSSEFAFLPPEKRGVGIVFQDYALFPNKTVRQNVEFGFNDPKKEKSLRREFATVMDLTNIVGLEDRYPSELSGGQQQRVALARALMYRPRILLLDEPFSNVDGESKSAMRRELHRIVRGAEITTVMVTHNREDAMHLSDKIAVMCDGQIKQYGACEEVYKFPCSSDVANICGPCNFVEGVYDSGDALTDMGRFRLISSSAKQFMEGDKLSLLLRPSDLNIIPSGDGGGAKVAYRKFSGDIVEYGIQIATGKIIRVFKLDAVPLGADGDLAVDIRPRDGAEFVAFKQSG